MPEMRFEGSAGPWDPPGPGFLTNGFIHRCQARLGI